MIKLVLKWPINYVKLAEICMEWTTIRERVKKEKYGVYMCFKGGLSLEAIPMKPLKPNLEDLTQWHAYNR